VGTPKKRGKFKQQAFKRVEDLKGVYPLAQKRRGTETRKRFPLNGKVRPIPDFTPFDKEERTLQTVKIYYAQL